MDLYQTFLYAAAGSSILAGAGIAIGYGVGAYIASEAKKRAENYEQTMEAWMDNRCRDVDDFVAGVRRRWTDLAHLSSEQITTAIDTRDTLEEMIEELREERDLMSQEIAALKVDAAEQSRVADAYAKQCERADMVISELTKVLNGAKTSRSSLLSDAHIESLTRTELKQSSNRGRGTIGRASDLERQAA